MPRAAVYDVIIVGGGAAGCVLASRLSADPARRVLLIEAGARGGGLWSRVPLGVGRILNDPARTWSLTTEPSPATDGIARAWTSGKCLGGSSAVNGMIFVRGHPQRYDAWGRIARGWSHAHCLPYFQRLEDWSGAAGVTRGRGGPVGVTLAEPDPLSAHFLDASADLGFARIDDYNDRAGVGASYLQLSTRGGRRDDAARAYLHDRHRRRNLTVLPGALAQRIELDGDRARAVIVRIDGRSERFEAAQEIVVSAGAVRSPHLLQVSGIGPPAVLARAGVRTRVANERVGAGLQDHLMVRLCFGTPLPHTVNAMLASPRRLAAEALRWALRGRGLFSSASLKSTLFASSVAGADAPDLRIQLGLVSAIDRVPRSIRHGLDPGSAFQIGVYGLYPEAAGAVCIRDGDIATAPRVQPDYLTQAADRRVLLQGMRLALALADTAAMRAVIAHRIRPDAGLRSDADLLAYARQTGQTCWHPVGTCAMGAAGQGAVDDACRVHGVRSLRVVDASVFPLMPASNTHAPTLMLAEKLADLIAGGVPLAARDADADTAGSDDL